jgi:Ca-activated chloride channel family protein
VLLWLLLLSAAARPQWLGEPLPIAASGRDLLVAVDVSGSMDFPTCTGRTKTSAA